MAYIHKRGKRWYYRIEVKDETGKRKRIERVGGNSRQECEKAYRTAMAEVDYSGDFSEPSNMTVSQFLDEWVAEYVEVNLRKNTIRSYKSTIKNHIKPALGEIKLRRVSARILQNFLNTKKEKYSAGTLGNMAAVLKKSFSWACNMAQYIRVDPAAIIQVPQYNEAPVKTDVFTPTQIRTLFARFDVGHQFYMPMMVAYHTGLRLGECLALSWADIDMDTRELSVRGTVVDAGGVGEIQPVPKSNAGCRTIPFGQKLYKILKAEKARQAAQKLAYGKHYNDNGLVCCWPDGSMLISDDMRYFGMYCKDTFSLGSFHSLRHTHATMLLEAGEDLEIVSKRLGHSSIAITAKVYSHVLDRRKSKTVKLLDEVL